MICYLSDFGHKGRGIQKNEKAKGVEKFRARILQHKALIMKHIKILMLHKWKKRGWKNEHLYWMVTTKERKSTHVFSTRNLEKMHSEYIKGKSETVPADCNYSITIHQDIPSGILAHPQFTSSLPILHHSTS